MKTTFLCILLVENACYARSLKAENGLYQGLMDGCRAGITMLTSSVIGQDVS